jgi:hypothetical protein
MTFCRACGQNSRTDDFCELCRRPLQANPSAGPAGSYPTMQMSPQPQTVRRVSLTGEVVETTQAMQPQQMQGALPIQPGYGSTQPAAPFAGLAARTGPTLPAGAYSPAAMMERAAAEGPPVGERFEKALAIGLPILALSMLAVHFAPSAMLGVVFGNLLVLPMILGATGAIPRYEDAILDCSVVLVVAILFGPLVALGAYLLTAMVKQECNGAIVALLGLNVVIKGFFGIAFAPAVDTLSLAAMWGLLNWTSFFGVCLSFLGWLLSSFFRPIND